MVLQGADGFDEPAVVGSTAGGRFGRVEPPPGCASEFGGHPLTVLPSSSAGGPGFAQCLELLVGQLDAGGGDVLLEMRDLRRPGIGSITGERLSSQASASWDAVAWCSAAMRCSGPSAAASGPAASGNHGMKPSPGLRTLRAPARPCER